MAITYSHVYSAANDTDAVAYGQGAYWMPANQLGLAFVAYRSVGLPPWTPTMVMGGQQDWYLMANYTNGNDRGFAVFRSMVPTDRYVSGWQIFSGQEMRYCAVQIVAVNGVDLTGTNGSGAIAYVSGTPATTDQVELYATGQFSPARTGNGQVAGFHFGAPAYSYPPRAAWSEVVDLLIAETDWGAQSIHTMNPASWDQHANAWYGLPSTGAAVIVEVNVASGVNASPTAGNVARTTTRPTPAVSATSAAVSQRITEFGRTFLTVTETGQTVHNGVTEFGAWTQAPASPNASVTPTTFGATANTFPTSFRIVAGPAVATATVPTPPSALDVRPLMNPATVLTETFTGDTIDAAKWDNYNSQQSGGRLIQPLNYDGPSITSVQHFDFTNASLAVQLFTINDTTAGVEVLLSINRDAQNQVIAEASNFGGTGFTLILTTQTNGIWNSTGTLPYDPAYHHWFRLRETGGYVYFDWSNDGITWNSYQNVALWMPFNDVTVGLAGVNWNRPTAIANAEWDNLTLQTSRPVVATANFPAPTVGGTVSLDASVTTTTLVRGTVRNTPTVGGASSFGGIGVSEFGRFYSGALTEIGEILFNGVTEFGARAAPTVITPDASVTNMPAARTVVFNAPTIAIVAADVYITTITHAAAMFQPSFPGYSQGYSGGSGAIVTIPFSNALVTPPTVARFAAPFAPVTVADASHVLATLARAATTWPVTIASQGISVNLVTFATAATTSRPRIEIPVTFHTEVSDLLIGTNGAVYLAPYGTALPTAHDSTLDPAFQNLGYLSPEGVDFSEPRTVETVRDWRNQTPKRLRTLSRNPLISFSIMQWNPQNVAIAFGGATMYALVLDAIDGDTVYRWTCSRVQMAGGTSWLLRRGSATSLLVTFALEADVDLYTNAAAFAT